MPQHRGANRWVVFIFWWHDWELALRPYTGYVVTKKGKVRRQDIRIFWSSPRRALRTYAHYELTLKIKACTSKFLGFRSNEYYGLMPITMICNREIGTSRNTEEHIVDDMLRGIVTLIHPYRLTIKRDVGPHKNMTFHRYTGKDELRCYAQKAIVEAEPWRNKPPNIWKPLRDYETTGVRSEWWKITASHIQTYNLEIKSPPKGKIDAKT